VLCAGAELLRARADLLCPGAELRLRSQVLPSPLPSVPPLLPAELLRADLLRSPADVLRSGAVLLRPRAELRLCSQVLPSPLPSASLLPHELLCPRLLRPGLRAELWLRRLMPRGTRETSSGLLDS